VTLYDVNAADPSSPAARRHFLGYDHGCALLDISGRQTRLLWQNKNMRKPLQQFPSLNAGIFGVDENELKCLALDTGEVKWSERVGKGSVTLADGRLIALGEKGELFSRTLCAGFKPVSRAQVLVASAGPCPVLADGRIYCRKRPKATCLPGRGREITRLRPLFAAGPVGSKGNWNILTG